MNRHADNPAFSLSGFGPKPAERGYILLVLSLFAALIAIGLMQALPTALVQTQREREEELIFRGEQYRRAVQNYVRKFGRYPNSIDDLEDTNGVRFLRRRYRDPITGEDEWRMIHIGPGGTFPDSKNSTAPPTQPGGQTDTGLTPSVAGAEPRGFSEQPSQFESTSGFGGPAAPAEAAPAAGDPADSGQNPEQVPPALRPSADPSANPAQQPRAFGAAQQPGQPGQPGVVAFGGGGIAGVASNSTDPSIKIYNGYLQYDEWEFIYNYQADQFGMAAVARATGGAVPGAVQPGVGAQPGVGTQPGAPPPGVMSSRPDNQVPGVPFPAPFGGPNVPPRYPAAQFPGMPPGARPGGFPGAQPGQFPGGVPGAQPGLTPSPNPGAAPGTQPRSPFESRPFPGFGQPSSPSPSPSPGFGAQPPRTNQPGQGFPTSPIPAFPPNQQPRR